MSAEEHSSELCDEHLASGQENLDAQAELLSRAEWSAFWFGFVIAAIYGSVFWLMVMAIVFKI